MSRKTSIDKKELLAELPAGKMTSESLAKYLLSDKAKDGTTESLYQEAVRAASHAFIPNGKVHLLAHAEVKDLCSKLKKLGVIESYDDKFVSQLTIRLRDKASLAQKFGIN